jgi:hypothetical protein
VREQHLDALAVTARSLEGLGLAKGTSDVAGVFMDAARDLARRFLRAALPLECAYVAIVLACSVEQLIVIHDLAGRREDLARRAGVDVALLSKVKSSREKVPSSRLDLSITGICGAIFLSLTSQLSIAADP